MIFPRANREEQEQGGWILDYAFLMMVREAIKHSWELEDTTLEDIETILIQAENIVEKELESGLTVSKQLKVIEKLTARLLHLEQEHDEKKRIMALPEDDNKSYKI